MAAFTMQLTDGTTTINFDNTEGYSLISETWAPQRAQRNESEMGHVYEDVIETIPIVITGGSHTHVMERYAALSDLLDQAESWGMDDAGVDAVLFKYQPNGSTLANPLQTPIWREPGSPRMLSAPSTTNEAGYRGNVLTPVIVTFTRLGQFLGADETEVAATSTGNPAIMTTATFTDTPKIPVSFDASIEFSANVQLNTSIYAAFTNAANKLYFKEGEDFTASIDVVVAGSSAGSVHKQDDTDGTIKLYDSGISMNADAGLYAIYAMVNGSVSATNSYWSIIPSFGLEYLSGDLRSQVTGDTYIYVPTVDDEPQVLFLGSMSTSFAPAVLMLEISPEAADGAATDISIDYVCVVALDDSTRIVVTSPEIASSALGEGDEVVIEHRLDSNRTPKVATHDDGSEYALAGYKGDALLAASGNAISCLVFGGRNSEIGGALGTYVIENSSGTELNVDLSITRTMGYLTPL